MTLKELFKKHGGVWLANYKNPRAKEFKPLGFIEDDSMIIGEDRASIFTGIYSNAYHSDYDEFVVWTEEKKKIIRWKYAFTPKNGTDWQESSFFFSDEELKAMRLDADKYIKLEYTRTEFDE